MIARDIFIVSVLSGLCFASCTNAGKTNVETQNAVEINTSKDMKSFISIFEIPATEISRAIDFYEAVLDIKIERIDMPEMQMGIFPYEGQMVTGVILQAEGYKPSADGVTLYLNGGDDLQIVLDKVEKNSGKILVPKTLHADESGYFAIFLDSEGNKMGLHSIK